jgi:AcrR family transcriptional regulator
LTNVSIPDSKDRVLIAADRLFMERGYKAVTLRDIATVLGIKHASLYYHAPGGKEQLYIEVTERNLNAHRAGLTASMAAAGADLRAELHAAAGWLLSQPPMDLMRMTLSDLHEIAPDQAQRLSKLVQESMLDPLSNVLSAAQTRGEIEPVDSGTVAGGLLAMLEGLHAVPDVVFLYGESLWRGKSRLHMAHYLVDIVLRGLLPRNSDA